MGCLKVAPNVYTFTIATSILNKDHDERDQATTCENFEGVSKDDANRVVGFTDFSSEACTHVSVGVSAPSSFIKPSDEYQDLLIHLARPRLAQSGTVPTTRGILSQANVTVANLDAWFNILNRLTGVHGIRFTIKFTVTTANTPFQQALLCSNFQYGSGTGAAYTYPRAFNSAFVTNLPHVLHDITEVSMSEFSVPFLYAYDYMQIRQLLTSGSLSATAGSLGIFSLNTLLPYRTIAGVAAPTFKVYVSLHDVELIGAAPIEENLVILQSGLKDAKSSKVKKSSNPIVNEEKAVRGSDKVLAISSKIRTISSYIPFLSSIGSTTSNVLDLAGNAAKMFGYAKPPVLTEPVRMWPNPHLMEGNVDVPSASYVLAPFQNNRLAVDSMAGGTDVDEMAIQYVIGKYGQCFVGNMATTDATGTFLYGTDLCPLNFWFRANSGRPGGNLPLPVSATASTNSIAMTPLAYTAQYFRNWRGTLKFRFTFAKTKFHGGRVIVGYIPSLEDNYTTPGRSTIPCIGVVSGVPSPFTYTQIFDLRDSNVFEFEAPYLSTLPFLSVFSSHGTVTMAVLDPLVQSGETTSTIDFMVEVCAKDDFEFSVPAPPMFSVATPGASQTNTVFLQSGLGDSDKATVDTGVTDAPDETVSQYTMGESIRSFKQLIMIPSFIGTSVAASSTAVTTLWNWWTTGRFTMANPLPTTSAVTFGFTRSGTIASMYAFATGSTEWHIYPFNASTQSIIMSVSQAPTESALPVAGGLCDPRNRSTVGSQRILSSEALHVRVPSYQETPRVLVGDASGQSSFTPGYSGSLNGILMRNVARFGITNGSTASVPYVMGRAAGEDARLMGYIGPPPVALLQATQSVNPDTTGLVLG